MLTVFTRPERGKDEKPIRRYQAPLHIYQQDKVKSSLVFSRRKRSTESAAAQKDALFSNWAAENKCINLIAGCICKDLVLTASIRRLYSFPKANNASDGGRC